MKTVALLLFTALMIAVVIARTPSEVIRASTPSLQPKIVYPKGPIYD